MNALSKRLDSLAKRLPKSLEEIEAEKLTILVRFTNTPGKPMRIPDGAHVIRGPTCSVIFLPP